MILHLSLGSNLTNRKKNLIDAISLLKNHIQILKISPIYETPALLSDQHHPSWNKPFLNLVLKAKATQPIHTLHSIFQEIERTLGRKTKHLKWSPRTIDIDILTCDHSINTAHLTIPHIELTKRDFVLAPFRDISPHLMVNQKSILSHYRNLKQKLIAWMDIFNFTPDSFSDGGGLITHSSLAKNAIQDKIKKNINHHVAWLDVGGHSTRPNALHISAEEEWNRIKPFFTIIKKFPNHLLKISVDTFQPEVAKKSLLCGVHAINDVSGLRNKKMIDVLKEFECDYILMHSLTVPADQSVILPTDRNPITEIKKWLDQKLNELQKNHISLDRIIFDPGIGFGKNAHQSLFILQNIEQFLEYPIRILIGHSNKSFLSLFSKKQSKDRWSDSLGISLFLAQKGVDMIRVHQAYHHSSAWLAFRHCH